MSASCNNAPKSSFYNVSTKTPWNELIGDALVLAKKVRITCSKIYDVTYESTPKKLNSDVQGDTSGCAKPPVDFKTKATLWPDQSRPGQAKAELLF